MLKIYNSPLEITVRILMILVSVNEPMAFDRILYYDFITNYGKEFKISESNLHGDSPFNGEEIAARRRSFRYALKKAVLEGLITPVYSAKAGFAYNPSEEGLRLIEQLGSSYKHEYMTTISKVVKTFNKLSAHELLVLIKTTSINKDVLFQSEVQ